MRLNFGVRPPNPLQRPCSFSTNRSPCAWRQFGGASRLAGSRRKTNYPFRDAVHRSTETYATRMEPLVPERVAFLGIEPDEDLILSFAISKGGPGEVVSLILHLSKYDSLLPDEVSGIHVSHEAYPDVEDEFLRKLAWKGEEVEVESTVRRYVLDISRVDPSEVKQAQRLLKRMNRRDRFELVLPGA
jgi:hypothetical protein